MSKEQMTENGTETKNKSWEGLVGGKTRHATSLTFLGNTNNMKEVFKYSFNCLYLVSCKVNYFEIVKLNYLF